MRKIFARGIVVLFPWLLVCEKAVAQTPGLSISHISLKSFDSTIVADIAVAYKEHYHSEEFSVDSIPGNYYSWFIGTLNSRVSSVKGLPDTMQISYLVVSISSGRHISWHVVLYNGQAQIDAAPFLLGEISQGYFKIIRLHSFKRKLKKILKAFKHVQHASPRASSWLVPPYNIEC